MAYIKLEDLRKFPFRLNSNEFNLGAEAVIEYAENLPTADVVEVVRCAECRYASKCTDGYYACKVDHRLAHDETDFCSYGERRDT